MKAKRLTAILLAATLLLSAGQTPAAAMANETTVPETISENTSMFGHSAHSQQEATNWASGQIGKSIDVDGYPAEQPFQCVDLIKAYYTYLGNGAYATGNANAYITNTLPAGWTRVYGNYQPGDIAVWKANHSCSTCTTGGYGHVGIITSADSVGFNAVNQNFCGKTHCTHNWFNVSALACAIRPDFGSAAAAVQLGYSNIGTDYIDDGNAILRGSINNPSRATVPRVGAFVWDSAGNLVVDYSEACNRNNNPIGQTVNIVMEAKVGLKPGSNYTFQLWAEANGQRFHSEKSSFKTTGTAPSAPSQPETTPSVINTTIEDTTSNGIYKITGTQEAAFTKPINSKKTSVIIPDTVSSNGVIYKVTTISANAFKNNKSITKATIGKNITSIGDYAFLGCKKLKNITIKTTALKSSGIGTKAFSNTFVLPTVKAPKSVLASYKKLLKAKGLSKIAIFKKL